MIQILNTYLTLPENAYFFNPITTQLIQNFSIIDNGHKYFEVNPSTIPYSNKIPVTFEFTIDHVGIVFINLNRRTLQSFYVPTPGTYKHEIILDLGVNRFQVVDLQQNEMSNAIEFKTKELYGYLIAAFGLSLNDIFQDLVTFINFNNIDLAEISALERIYGPIIHANKQSIETDDQFRALIKYYKFACAFLDTDAGLRAAGIGLFTVQSLSFSFDHYARHNKNNILSDHYKLDGDTWILNDNVTNKYSGIHSVVKGNLLPGVYDYIVLGRLVLDFDINKIGIFRADVRHWMTPSTVVLEWDHIGDPQAVNYQVYRYDPVSAFYRLVVETTDNKAFDVGDPLNDLTFFEFDKLDPNLFLLSNEIDVKYGYNTNVRSFAYETDSPIIIYADLNEPEPSSYDQQVLDSIYRLVVSAHLPYELQFVQSIPIPSLSTV